MGGEVRQVKSYSRLVCAKVQMCPKTFAHDCKCTFLITEDIFNGVAGLETNFATHQPTGCRHVTFYWSGQSIFDLPDFQLVTFW